MKIFLDDIRDAPDSSWTTVRSWDQLRRTIALNPKENIEEMSFDHDLGEGHLDGYSIIKMMYKFYPLQWPEKITVHSQNPVGKENIEKFAVLVRENLPVWVQKLAKTLFLEKGMNCFSYSEHEIIETIISIHNRHKED